MKYFYVVNMKNEIVNNFQSKQDKLEESLHVFLIQNLIKNNSNKLENEIKAVTEMNLKMTERNTTRQENLKSQYIEDEIVKLNNLRLI